jgi:dTDP-4-amino-4,6-dideoxygalactose transaminase
MEAKGIRCQVHYIPIHLQPFYKNNYGFKSGDFPVAEEFYRQEISIPMYPTLEEIDLNYIISSLTESLES